MKNNQTSDLFNVHHCLSRSACSFLIYDRQLHTGIYKLINEPKRGKKIGIDHHSNFVKALYFLYRNP